MGLSLARRFASTGVRTAVTSPSAFVARRYASSGLTWSSAAPKSLAKFTRTSNEPVLFFWDPHALGLDGVIGKYLAGFIVGTAYQVATLSDEIDPHQDYFSWSGFYYTNDLPPGHTKS